MSTAAPVIIVFGISGDLSKRKLLPALYHLLTHDLLDPDTRIVGTSRREMSEEQLLSDVELCILEEQKMCDPVGLKRMKDALQIVTLNTNSETDFADLVQTLDELDNEGERDRLFYMAIPPSAFVATINTLGENKLNDKRTRILVEKPFGEDTKTATELIEASQQHFDEAQIYRIDHYLAKETAQNLLTFRTHNPIFATLWNGEHIDKIHILASESLGVENRIDFYEQTGALRDLIQGHLLQLLAIIMMDQPVDSSSQRVHEAKEALLESLSLTSVSEALRGQYDGYKDEVKNQGSFVETYARISLKSEMPIWNGTRIMLETGKAMKDKLTEVTVQFNHRHEDRKNQLRFRIQPDEKISLDLVVKVPGFDDKMQYTQLDFSYEEAFKSTGHPDAYERVIMDAVKADHSLFASSKEVTASWKIVEPLLEVWKKNNDGLISYPKGSEHPSELADNK